MSGCQATEKNNLLDRGVVGTDDFRRPDFGQPERMSDLRGLVKSSIGNEITLLKIERPQRDEDELNQGDKTEEKEGGEETRALSMSGGGGMPGMGRGMRGGGAGEDDEEQRLERMKSMASGEETVLIPVGIQMLKPDSSADSKEPQMLEATLEDIKTDTMIQVWLNESVSDRKVAEFVLIMN